MRFTGSCKIWNRFVDRYIKNNSLNKVIQEISSSILMTRCHDGQITLEPFQYAIYNTCKCSANKTNVTAFYMQMLIWLFFMYLLNTCRDTRLQNHKLCYKCISKIVAVWIIIWNRLYWFVTSVFLYRLCKIFANYCYISNF